MIMITVLIILLIIMITITIFSSGAASPVRQPGAAERHTQLLLQLRHLLGSPAKTRSRNRML